MRQFLPVPPYLSAMLMSMSDFKLSIVLSTSSLPFPAAHMKDVLPSKSESSLTEGCVKNTLTVSCKKTLLETRQWWGTSRHGNEAPVWFHEEDKGFPGFFYG